MIRRHIGRATLLAAGLHGTLVLAGVYRLSYDAYNHMFFADHYRMDWWSLWEPRWYTGFWVTSYPPLVHQLVGLLGRLVGVDAAYALLTWLVLSLFPLAVYQFSHIFTGRRAAGYSAYAAAVLPALFLAGYVFGQLPTLTGTLLALFAAAALAGYLRQGGILTLATAISLTAVVMAAHHATLLFLPWLFGAVLLRLLLERKASLWRVLARFAGFALGAALAIALVIFPFWQWGAGQQIQTPIDHLSRHNFFKEGFAFLMFFLPVYGLFLLLIPWIYACLFGRKRHLRLAIRRRFLGLALAFLLLLILGLGGTTPLPRWLFGAGWAWLTYDRFALWAALLLLVFAGPFLALMRFKTRAWLSSRGFPLLTGIGLVASLAVVFAVVMMPRWLPTQPTQLDMQPIVDFLAQPSRSGWRYLTFGFGDQMAYLSRLTSATTLDGSYHTARTLAELRNSGIAQIDGAVWLPNGLPALDSILELAGERGVRWGFVLHPAYIPVLERHGWVRLEALPNGVAVYENPSAQLPGLSSPVQPDSWTAFAWGTFPLLALTVSAGLATRLYLPGLSRRLFPALRAILTGLLPFGLTFWYFRPLFAFPHKRIYFIYSDALFFLSDALALAILLVALVERLPAGKINLPRFRWTGLRGWFGRLEVWFFCLCLVATLSSLWSRDWRTSLTVSLHLWLVFGLFLVLRSRPDSWKWLALGSGAALLVQVGVAAWQFAAQTTEFLAPLGMEWPGPLLPSMRGTSVVQLADGTRWLRAYGSLPHPNLLGGISLFFMGAGLPLIYGKTRWRYLSMGIFLAGLVALVLSFSRSAWVGLLVLGGVALLFTSPARRRQLVRLALLSLIPLVVLVILLNPLFLTRLGSQAAPTEQVSNYTRLWLLQRTFEIMQQAPLLGVGIGSYSLALSQHVAEFYQIEPVHNLPLLVISEMGILGAFLVIWLLVLLWQGARQKKRAAAALSYALVISLLAVSLFDHYLWTLAPGRMLLGIGLGLWSGSSRLSDDLR